MGTGSELCPGGTYLLDDFTIVHIVAIESGYAHTRMRTGLWRRRVAVRRVRLSRLRRRVRAEIDGDFFPDIAVAGLRRFVRPASEVAALQAHLAQRAGHRPFAGGA